MKNIMNYLVISGLMHYVAMRILQSTFHLRNFGKRKDIITNFVS